MKLKTKLTIASCASLLIAVFCFAVFWLSGNEFVRGYALGGAFAVSLLLSVGVFCITMAVLENI
jgi:multisubunit Na+/H+ antiporter MnhG subunit